MTRNVRKSENTGLERSSAHHRRRSPLPVAGPTPLPFCPLSPMLVPGPSRRRSTLPVAGPSKPSRPLSPVPFPGPSHTLVPVKSVNISWQLRNPLPDRSASPSHNESILSESSSDKSETSWHVIHVKCHKVGAEQTSNKRPAMRKRLR